ncbi:hypothetical protein [Halorubrum sp. N11]|uniref:hypothetical protein n=1 Tax=Halorubrum sp. N11 TaxID=3402276 RepID=UPI003EB742EC
MRRRQAVALTGVFGLAGCLRMQNNTPSDTTGGSEEERDNPDGGGPPPGESNAYDSRSDAIAFVSEPATDGTLDLDWGTDELPDGVAYSRGSSGGGGTTGPADTYYNSSQFSIEPTSSEAFKIDADADVEIRFDDVARDTTASFVVGDEFDGIEATRIRISLGGEGSVTKVEPQFFDRTREETATMFAGEWTGDTDMFYEATFGEYAVELVVDGTSRGRTGSRVLGMGYQWRLAQTESTCFLTRHGLVSEDVEATLRIERSHVSANQRPDEGVFEFDLSALDVDAGAYNWTIEIHEASEQRPYHIYLPIYGRAIEIQVP